ncbi:M23 family metallopeptidase [Geobacter sp. DSM 9736]|uniref:M23 family metallopeptidase n=1 Tax=Geobacter sp. DSM 9736 TaxID=1277350 RepID=UPI000B502509|nr:M23 family metallopeptidase [Geobacter sp. DSM 9736]SNB44627.1 Peptidase family M23 [Geobacter sp. DSM 9736]
MTKHLAKGLLLAVFFLSFSISPIGASGEQPETMGAKLVAPVEGALKYPFTKDESIRCGRWRKGSQDYPYFGAPRDRNRRRHAGVDLYPVGGAGSPVRAVADGTIIKIAPFYTRANGEVTYAVLVDHHDFVANYAELLKPDIKASAPVRQGEVLGRVSGTKQLHFEMYTRGTKDWSKWYGERPANLIDPTDLLKMLLMGQASAEGQAPLSRPSP